MNNYFPPPTTLLAGSKVWAYVRYAAAHTPESAETNQRDEIEKYCQEYDLELTSVFTDTGRSGSNLKDGPALLELIEKSSQPDFRPNGLLVWASDRLSRDMEDALRYRTLLQQNGLVVHSLNNDAGATSRLINTLWDIWNTQKREQNAKDVKRAMKSLFEQGYSFGVPPHGYMREQVVIKNGRRERTVSRWIPDPVSWNAVKLAWQMRAKGCSYQEIQDATEGLIYKAKKSWSVFFRCKTYLGIGIWGNLEVPNHHPAAIDQATWDAVQKLLKKNL